MKKAIYALAIAIVIAGAVSAADDPFCGKWKLNKEKSKVTGEQMKIQDLGNNQLKFTRGATSDTVKTDGSDQPVHYGYTMSITPDGQNSFKMVIKKDGKVISSMTHSLSEDGNTQTIKGTDYRPDGSTSDFDVVDKRVGGGTGWTGTWQSTKVDFNSPDELEIDPNGANGLTFKVPAYKDTLSLKFDGKDYPEEGPTVAAGSTASAKRVDARQFEMTDKVKGKVMDHSNAQVSPDGNTLTLTVHETGQPNPQTYVYDKM